MSSDPARTYREFIAHWSLRQRLRSLVRDAAVCVFGASRSISRTTGWIGFPYYHHVFDDERAGFSRQLKFLRRFGEFIGLDDAVRILAAGERIDGRYFCLTFDDGFRNVLTNACPILVENNACAAFFLPTRFIDAYGDADGDTIYRFFDHGRTLMEFLTWDEVRALVGHGMTIGSHSVSHACLADLDRAAVETELQQSKRKIEEETGSVCHHFCCPFGQPGVDFDPAVHPGIAEKAGYRSFLTTQRGVNVGSGSPVVVRRDHMLAGWSNLQIRYFFGVR